MFGIRDSGSDNAPMENSATKIETHLTIETNGERAIDLLAEATPSLSRQQIKRAMQCGAVWMQHGGQHRRLRRVTQPMNKGEKLDLYYDDYLLSLEPPPAAMLADEQQYSVWYKPKGLLAQGTMFGDHCSLLYFAEKHFTPRRDCLLVHRLDNGADGLMLIAHSRRSAAVLSELFQKRSMEKHYRVTVEGAPALQAIDTPLDGKDAITRILSVTPDPAQDRSVLDVTIDTGRKHQIRRHLASIGHPVIGDREYGHGGGKQALQLSAISLAFLCPITNQQRLYQVPEEYLD